MGSCASGTVAIPFADHAAFTVHHAGHAAFIVNHPYFCSLVSVRSKSKVTTSLQIAYAYCSSCGTFICSVVRERAQQWSPLASLKSLFVTLVTTMAPCSDSIAIVLQQPVAQSGRITWDRPLEA